MAAAAKSRLSEAVRRLGSTTSRAWLTASWGHLGSPASEINETALTGISLPGSPTSYVVGIANPGSGRRLYNLTVDTARAPRTIISRVLPVLASDGRLVFDAIDPHPLAGVTLEPGELVYLLVREGRDSNSGVRRLRITDDENWTQDLAVSVTVLGRIEPQPEDQPRVIVWAYTRDRPIWHPGRRAAIVERLSQAGVNVFVVHPRNLPQPMGEEEWEKRLLALREDLDLYRGRGIVLLYVGEAGWARLVDAPEDSATRRRLSRWVTLIAKTMKESGYGSGDWALYPLDEPQGGSFAPLATVIRRLLDIEPRLHFYANPIAGRGPKAIFEPQLRDLKDLVNYWQPHVGEAFVQVQSILGADHSAALWFYSNPPAPARTALPACYRDLGRQAFNIGASGLGFWSFSQTGDSSAWSDFDGTGSDWAVVYEGESSFVSSRRWEAFQQGVRDFAALNFCARVAASDSDVAKQCRQFRVVTESIRDYQCEIAWR